MIVMLLSVNNELFENSQKLEGKERKDFKNQNVIASQNEN